MNKYSPFNYVTAQYPQNPFNRRVNLRPAWPSNLGALIAGLLLPLAFAPFHIYLLSVLAPAFWLILLSDASPQYGFWRGWLFGLGFFGIGISWIYISLSEYGQANAVLAAIITALLIMVLALFPAVLGYVLTRFFPANTVSKYLLAFPALWVLLEWVRTWFFSGFPWLFLGYSQIASPLSGFAPLVGVFGVSFAVAVSSGVIVVAIMARKHFRLALSVIVLLLALWIGGEVLDSIRWTHPSGNPVKVTLVQGNVAQQLKWRPEQAIQSLLLYKKLTLSNLEQRIVIWPEAAITFYQTQVSDFLAEMDQLAKSQQSTLISGIPIALDDRYYNGMLALGQGSGVYLKRHLVPFGEYMPFRSILRWLKNYVIIPMSDFDSGPKHQALLTANGIPIATFICYEIAYPTLVLNQLPKGQLLITLSDDSWFGKSLAPAQHLEILQMRALETGRFALMSTNDGITAIVTPKGKIIAAAPPFREFILTGKVQPMSGSTPWMQIGIYPILVLMGIFLLYAYFNQRKMRHR
ncbi:MAG TPA: apolipoprotein N-acyltransferase [Gammaproteobacteria bacterium]|nr:apolipoprotein N-acyltransferase [Gammaproteobacteria bacterium]